MPKLTNHTFAITTEDGHRHHFASEIHVSTDGEFSCTVPDFLVAALGSVGVGSNKFKPTLYVQKLKVNHRAYAPSKADLLKFVDEAHRQHHQAEVTTDLIICYDWFAEVSYWLNPDGTMAANGSMPDAARRNDDGSGGNWAVHNLRTGQTICANNTAKHFAVGVYAAVHKRTTYTRASGATVTWERITQFDSQSTLGEWGKKLTGLCGLSAPKSAEHLRQMPYTDEAARFFYESMMAMCEIGRRFKNFFGDEANVMAAIEGRGPSLLAGPTLPAQPTLTAIE
ncbi:hypothetical protein [Pseudomonas syringae]|uniref:hypothetical protein n=1 Tax=Pseudomonas syringae TaxID=317 RepID=UPI002459B4DD|nr:hypothetical protein [Pseudomonas syringae]MDH4602322.1 hypothetical protein [Pseudomonas syringae pv. papulans]